ncbi:MAG: AAA family ATPase [Actinobacteria bacterium]|nr:AAA family ATPase [Actinomycetota bacterium]MBW3648733.1 AAA family ATPase [Actinomycetota bacterium]
MTVPKDSRLLSNFVLEQYTEIGTFLHLSALLERGHKHVVLRELDRHASDSVLPERAVVVRTVQGNENRHVLAEVDDALVLLQAWKSDAHIWVSADDEAIGTAIADEIQSRVPRLVEERRVDVEFSDAHTGSRTLALDVCPWNEARCRYPAGVRDALDILAGHVPRLDGGRRLILWHGEPGTGKTSAVRALVHAWRTWADTVVVTDPDALLKDGRYLRRILLDSDNDERWTLFVLEDAEALLRKETGGSAMGKLLNLADGLLGQGLRCLFLLTTNEPLGAIHPAIVRPGRCLAQVEFGRLPAGQAAGLLGRPVDRAMTLAEVMTAAPVESRLEPMAVGQYL